MADNICALPKSVALHVTELCNLRCKMCYFWGETGTYSNAESGAKPVTLDIGLLKRIVKELAPANAMYSLFGGEPLMYPDLEEMILAIKEAKSIVDTPTNGTLLEKHAPMLVRTGFDSVRVSIDGPKEINDSLRGKGSYEKATAGIEILYRERQKSGKSQPLISILYTVTPENHLSIEKFFLEDLDLSTISFATIQMENFITKEMGEAYAEMLKTEFGITSDRYWRAMVRSPENFSGMDTVELSRQVNEVIKRMRKLGKFVMLLPPDFSPENIKAYLAAKWDQMVKTYSYCPVPWNGADITASGDIAPCHVFYDLVMGNLYENSFEDVWNGEMYQHFRAYMKEHKLMPICQGCCILYIVGF